MNITLRHKDFCDGCDQMTELNTLGQHKRCRVYRKNFLPKDEVFIANKGLGYIERLEICKQENEARIKK